MAYVIGLVHGEKGAYGISYPDFPGCIAGGVSIDEAVSRGEDALAVHIDSILEDEEPLPVLRSRDAILNDPELQDELKGAVLVAVPMPSARRARVHVMIDEGLLAAVERAAEVEGFTRSGYFERAVRDRLIRQGATNESSTGQSTFLARPVAVANLQSVGVTDIPRKDAPASPACLWLERRHEIVDQGEFVARGNISSFVAPSWKLDERVPATILCSTCSAEDSARQIGERVYLVVKHDSAESLHRSRKATRKVRVSKIGEHSGKEFSK